MRLTNVRLPESVHEQVQAVAGAMGVSTAQYVREAVILRLGMDTVIYAYELAEQEEGFSATHSAAVRKRVRALFLRAMAEGVPGVEDMDEMSDRYGDQDAGYAD